MTPSGKDAPFLARASGAVAALVIVLYGSWFMPFFQPFFSGKVGLARLVFYALYGSLLLVSAAVLVLRADIRRRIMPFAIALAIGLAATALHPIGLVTRAYIIAVVMGGATMVLIMASAPGALLLLTAVGTLLNAALCLVDLPFAAGFTNTVGRAAGLAINPNDAAAGILLGAAASYRVVPQRFRASFLVLTAGSLAVTLSRSTILAAAGAALIPVAVGNWRGARRRTVPTLKSEGRRLAALCAVGLVAWVGLAGVTNGRFRPVVQATIADSLSAARALGTAHDAVATEVHSLSPPSVSSAVKGAVPHASDGAVTLSGSPPRVASAAQPSEAVHIAALDARLSGEGTRNTISARTLFLERAMLVYRHNGFFGVGLEDAQFLAPHNTFVFFALAFGHLGWLIPIAVVGLALYPARDARDLPLALAAVGTMLTSHDILVTPSLFLPIAIGIGGMIAREPEYAADQRLRRGIALGAATAVVLFAVGCLVIVLVAPALTVDRITPASITTYRGAYLASIPPRTFPGILVSVIGPGPENTAMFLRENSRPLRRVEWNGGANPAVAPGEYAVADPALVLAPRDGSDPRVGGHIVELGLPSIVGPLFYVLMAILAGWCASVISLFGRAGASTCSVATTRD